MIKNIPIITASSYLAMFFLGFCSALVGAAARNIGLSPYQIGLIIAVQNLGFMVGVLIAGALADSHSKPRLLLVGSLILAAALLTFYAWTNFWLNVIIMFFIGAGIGSYEGATDAMLLDIHPGRESLHININHFFVTFGAILVTVYLIFLQMAWRTSVIQAGVIVLALAVVFALIYLPARRKTVAPYLERLRLLGKERLIIILFIASALVVGLEGGSVGILTTYLMDLRGFDQVASKIGLVLFLTGMAAGRLALGYLTPKDRIHQFILGLLGLSTLVYAALYFLDLGAFVYATIFLAGLTLSAILPLMLSLAGLLYAEIAGTVLGVLKVAFPLGGILLPFLLGMLSEVASFQAALIIFPLSSLLALLLTYTQFRSLRLRSIPEAG